MIRRRLAVVSGLALACVVIAGCGEDDRFSTTPTPVRGPLITFFGITRADDTLVASSGTNAKGLPIFSRPTGSGFRLVIEAQPGTSGATVGGSAFQEDASSFPDLQIEVSRPLGDGSAAVCDNTRDMPGGVPAVNPPSFKPSQTNINAVNDLGCRFNDGQGHPQGVDQSGACVLFPTGEYHFVNAASTIEFCGFITGILAFPAGDTVVTARVRDTDENAGTPAQIVIHIGS